MVPQSDWRRRAPYVDVTAAMDERPRSRAVSLKVVPHPAGRRLGAATRSVRRGGGVIMASAGAIRALRSIRVINSPGREGLTGTAPANSTRRRASASRSRSRRTAGHGGAAGLAAGLPDRLAAGSLRRAPGLHEVPGAHERRVHRRPVLDRGAELVAAAAAASGEIRRVASVDEIAVGGDARVSAIPASTIRACWCG